MAEPRRSRSSLQPAAAASPETKHGWPALPLEPWLPTLETLHLWTQVVGKVRLALTDVVSHWWSCTLRPTPRGLATGVMYHGRVPVELAFDFVAHRLVIDVGRERRLLALEPRSVADFHQELLATLAELGAGVRIHPVPNELPDPIPFPDDDVHAAYDTAAVERFQAALLLADHALRRHRARFLGKSSPVHFFWGSFDLAVTRFSGRTAPPHPGGFPHLPLWVVREAYSHECHSAGWWPGQGGLGHAAFYAYAYPEPDGYRAGAALPEGSYYHEELREYVLPWEAALADADPEEAVRSFLEETWGRVAEAGGWDRPALERDPEEEARLNGRVRAADAPVE
ncbi:MAG TPA: DUF5996 family protein [Longimicrobiales bacterium]|nr:DUF5996 family protein [Longimicrobiales bacterium]